MTIKRNIDKNKTKSSIGRIVQGHEKAIKEFGREDTRSVNRVLGTNSRLSNRGKKRR